MEWWPNLEAISKVTPHLVDFHNALCSKKANWQSGILAVLCIETTTATGAHSQVVRLLAIGRLQLPPSPTVERVLRARTERHLPVIPQLRMWVSRATGSFKKYGHGHLQEPKVAGGSKINIMIYHVHSKQRSHRICCMQESAPLLRIASARTRNPSLGIC